MCHMSRVTCHVSHVTCNVSHVILFNFFRTKWGSLSVEGLLSTGPTPSSLNKIYKFICDSKHMKYSLGRKGLLLQLLCYYTVKPKLTIISLHSSLLQESLQLVFKKVIFNVF